MVEGRKRAVAGLSGANLGCRGIYKGIKRRRRYQDRKLGREDAVHCQWAKWLRETCRRGFEGDIEWLGQTQWPPWLSEMSVSKKKGKFGGLGQPSFLVGCKYS